jgi:UDP-N-acetylmuramate dehydrogenase
VRRLATEGLAGLEFAAGIPGTAGGAVAVNAGAHGSEMSEVVRRVVVMVEGERRLLGSDAIAFSYRKSQVPGAVLEVELELSEAAPELVREKVERFLGVREETQPVWKRTAGCMFKNPPGDSAGRIIDSQGLKGINVGGARVSELHANFIVNADEATAADLLALIRMVRERVSEETGIQLELEVELIGDFAQ